MAISVVRNYKNPEGRHWRYGYTITLDSSYPSGGYLVTESALGINTIKNVLPGIAASSNNASSVLLKWNKTTKKLIAYKAGGATSNFAETSGSLANYTCEVEVLGY